MFSTRASIVFSHFPAEKWPEGPLFVCVEIFAGNLLGRGSHSYSTYKLIYASTWKLLTMDRQALK